MSQPLAEVAAISVRADGGVPESFVSDVLVTVRSSLLLTLAPHAPQNG